MIAILVRIELPKTLEARYSKRASHAFVVGNQLVIFWLDLHDLPGRLEQPFLRVS
jgi:hypothetical protein